MHPDELENWQKIKDHFEAIGKTDNYYYKRAVLICNGEKDPLVSFSKMENEAE